MNTKKVKLRFYTDGEGGWFADVNGHTQAQNRMVAGADKLCEAFADGANEVTITMTKDAPFKNADGTEEKAAFVLKRLLHDPWGATYTVHQEGRMPKLIWLCNVTHTVFGGDHPKAIYVYEIKPGAVSSGEESGK